MDGIGVGVRPMSNQQQAYGGYWTQVKLQRVRQYLEAFMEETKEEPYNTVYVDAFSGSGIVTMPLPEKRQGGFTLLPESDKAPYIEGSAVQSLRLPQLFNKYYFVDRSRQCCSRLRKLIRSNFAPLQERVNVECQD